MTALRVLHMDTEKGWRGGEQQALYLAEGLKRRGVTNLCVGQPGKPYAERCAAKGLDVAPLRSRGEADPRAVIQLRAILRSFRPDIIHMHTSHAHTLGVLAARSARIGRTVVSRRVDFTIYRNALRLSWLKYRFGVDRYVAISEGVRAQMLKDGIPAERIRIVHSGIELAKFDGVKPHDFHAEFGLPRGAPVILDVAAFGWHKAQEVLVRATPLILAEHPETRVFLVGEGECLPAVRAEAEKLGVAERIVFTGFRTDVPSLLAGADVFVMCSVLEGLCTSLLDALALRRPCVGSAVGGIPEVLIDQETGLTVPPRDPAALAAAILRVLGDRALGERLASAGRRHVEAKFTNDAMVEGTLGVYRELLGERLRVKGRWTWTFALSGAALLLFTAFLAMWAFEEKDVARKNAGRRLDEIRDGADRVLREYFAIADEKLAAAVPGEPAPPPFTGVVSRVSEDIVFDELHVSEPDIWCRFGRSAIHFYRSTAPKDFVAARLPLAEFEARLKAETGFDASAEEAKPEAGPDTDAKDAKFRLAIVERGGEILFPSPPLRDGKPKKLDKAPGRITSGRKSIDAGERSVADEKGLPEKYKNADDKLVCASWAPVIGTHERLWALAEVRDKDVVRGTAGFHVEILGYEVGEAMAWHFTLGLGLLLLLLAAFIGLPGRKKGKGELSVLLRTYEFAKPYRWGIVAAIGVGAVFAGSRAYRAFLAKNLVDDVLISSGPEAEAAIWKIVWATLVLGAITATSNYFKEYLQNYYSTSMMADIRVAMARKMVSLPLSFFNRIRSGELVARIERDVAGMRQVLMQVFEKAFVAPFTMVGAIVIAFMMNWRLALVLLGLPILIVPVFRIAKRIKKRAEKRQNLLADISHVLFQMLTGIKVVKAFHGEEREANRLDKANRKFIQEARHIARLSAFSDSLMDFLQMVGGAIVVGAGGFFVLRGEVEVGDLVGFMVVILSVYDAAKDITSVLNKLIESLPSVQRVFEIFDTPNDLPDGPLTAPAGALTHGIELRGVRFRYLENEILKSVDLLIPAGQVVAVVGPTGAGKTTLCDLVARFYDPTSGQVMWDGVDCREYTTKSLAAKLAIVGQDAFLFNTPIDENIRYGRPAATDAEVAAAADDANVHDEILQMEGGYSKMAGERGMSLSGGQRQRVTIARALIKDAPVLILDEATSNLDTASEKRVQAALAKLMAGRTVLVVAHRLSTIRNADKVVVMDEGRIVEEGAPDELLRRPGGRFKAMYDLQRGKQDDGDGAAA